MKKIIITILVFIVMSGAVYALPVASNYRFDGRAPIGNDPIPKTPEIKIQVLGNNVSADSLVLDIDGVQVTTTNPVNNYKFNGTDFIFTVTQALKVGRHTFTFNATDDDGAMVPYTFQAYVDNHGLEISEPPLAIPNPATRNTRITYKLTQDGEIDLSIYNLSGEKVWQQELSAGENGAKAGYNEVVWNLQSGFYEPCANGPYLCIITKREDGRVVLMEKLKIFILR